MGALASSIIEALNSSKSEAERAQLQRRFVRTSKSIEAQVGRILNTLGVL